MDRLVSKIAAGGISAGVFLIWWPQHVHSEDLVHLVIRGLLWTLTFELLLVSFGPLEDAVRARLRKRLEVRSGRVRTRFDAVPAPARAGGTLALACMGLALPALLLAGGPTELVDEDEPQVVKQVVVERPVIEKKVVVRRVVERAPLASSGAAPSVAQTTPAAAPAPAAKTAATQPAAKKVMTEKATEPKAAKTTVADADTQTTPVAPATTEAPATTQAAETPAPAAAEQPAAAAATP